MIDDDKQEMIRWIKEQVGYKHHAYVYKDFCITFYLNKEREQFSIFPRNVGYSGVCNNLEAFYPPCVMIEKLYFKKIKEFSCIQLIEMFPEHLKIKSNADYILVEDFVDFFFHAIESIENSSLYL